MSRPKVVPQEDSRMYFFENVEASQQADIFNHIKYKIDSILLLSRLDRELDMKEFAKLCSNVGKPKEFFKLARYSELMKGQVLITFDSVQDKRYFMNVMRIVYPDFLSQELSKIVKFFCMSQFQEEKEIDWKDFFIRAFKETQTVFLSTGAEVLATDYRLSKHALMQPFMETTCVVVEMSNSFYGLELFLHLNDGILQKTGVFQSFQLYALFEADEEQKVVTVEKKELQKIEDDAEKAEKHISNYIDKQMAMIMSADKYKEKGLDKASAQVKTVEYLKQMGDQLKKVKVTELVKYLDSTKPYIAELTPEDKDDLAHQILYIQDANKNQGPFTRNNEPLLFITAHNVQRYWDYDHLKYSNKRDPTVAEMEQSLYQFNPAISKELSPVIQKLQGQKDTIKQNYCCITHAVSQNLLNADSKNMCRDVNKLAINAFFNEIGLKQGDQHVDAQFFTNYAESSRRLNSVMPVLNSVHLWGRYKQQFDADIESVTIYHTAPQVDQKYHSGQVYRNINWVYGMKSLSTALKFGGEAVYIITIPKEHFNSICHLCKDSYVIPPMQVIQYLESQTISYPQETELPYKSVKLHQFKVVDDYKNFIKWQRKEVIKGH
ncbi:UNKNOWN [Stylonychia lemnae]|uniref:Uncharacterized protein n=1 Tax=Stylonychia lemnae TaxID=5949 RepID=A0A078B564_STYLE|nr:UNKNOWN [Stylonychia lemnae]|eukprot:CDW88387.1 UNKNOWN [Stylonychia lemnae]